MDHKEKCIRFLALRALLVTVLVLGVLVLLGRAGVIGIGENFPADQVSQVIGP